MRAVKVYAHLTFNLLDFQGVDRNGDQVVTPEEFAPAFDRVYAAILAHYSLSSSGPPVRMTRDKYGVVEACADARPYLCISQQVLALEMTSTLPDVLGPGHVHLATFILNGRLQEQILEQPQSQGIFHPNQRHAVADPGEGLYG